jgi:hypothetical protein
MDYEDISPKYIMELVPKVEEALWSLFNSSRYENVRRYIEKWHQVHEGYNNWDIDENFQIYYRNEGKTNIDLAETLHKMPKDILIKIAIDLGIDTPTFLPIVPQFKNVLKDENQSAYQNFTRATQNVHENPDQSVSLASSTLEGIIKTILADDHFSAKSDELKAKSLTKLISSIIKEFGFDDKTICPPELITIASQLRGLGKTIDDLRSDKTTAHGKVHGEYIIDDPLWAAFIINTSASLGLFLWEYFEKKYKPNVSQKRDIIEDIGDQPIDLDNIPF